MNKAIVWLVSLLNPLWKRFGADPRALGLILATKLKMDGRGGMSLGKRKKSFRGQEYLTYFLLLLFGSFMIGLFFVTGDAATAVGLIFSVWVCYIGLMLITEMSENLFDQRDLYVLLSRPITSVTLSLSRMLHIAVFAGKFAFFLGLPSFVYLAGWQGIWPALAFVLCGIVALVMILTGTLVFYLTLLRRVPTDRVKKIIGYFQVVATFVFFMAYQLPSLLGDVRILQDLLLVDQPLGFVFPGLWVGGLFKLLTTFSWGPLAVLQTVLALAAAAGGSWFYVRQSRGYAGRLLAMRLSGSEDVGEETVPEVAGKAASSSPVRDFLARWLTRPNQERASFNFHWNVMTRDLTFKQRTYPGLVYLPAILAISIFRDVLKGEEEFAVGAGTAILLLYFLMWMVVIPLGQTKVSENYRAAWVFSATANEFPGRINFGQLMAVLAMFFLPVALLTYAAVLAYWGTDYWLDVLLAFPLSILYSLMYNSVDKAHPFSVSKDDSKFQNFLPFLLVGVFGSAAGYGHYWLREVPYFLPVATVLAWLLLVGVLWGVRRERADNPEFAL